VFEINNYHFNFLVENVYAAVKLFLVVFFLFFKTH